LTGCSQGFGTRLVTLAMSQIRVTRRGQSCGSGRGRGSVQQSCSASAWMHRVKWC